MALPLITPLDGLPSQAQDILRDATELADVHKMASGQRLPTGRLAQLLSIADVNNLGRYARDELMAMARDGVSPGALRADGKPAAPRHLADAVRAEAELQTHLLRSVNPEKVARDSVQTQTAGVQRVGPASEALSMLGSALAIAPISVAPEVGARELEIDEINTSGKATVGTDIDNTGTVELSQGVTTRKIGYIQARFMGRYFQNLQAGRSGMDRMAIIEQRMREIMMQAIQRLAFEGDSNFGWESILADLPASVTDLTGSGGLDDPITMVNLIRDGIAAFLRGVAADNYSDGYPPTRVLMSIDIHAVLDKETSTRDSTPYAALLESHPNIEFSVANPLGKLLSPGTITTSDDLMVYVHHSPDAGGLLNGPQTFTARTPTILQWTEGPSPVTHGILPYAGNYTRRSEFIRVERHQAS